MNKLDNSTKISLLKESYKLSESLKLTESVSSSESSKFLGVLEGPVADYAHPTRNNILYGEALWDNVMNDSFYREGIETLTIIGELDHPEERSETWLKEGALVLLKMWKDTSRQLIMGRFGILPTPNGKLLKTYYDSGCLIGVSSRGEGDMIEGTDEVDPESYYFIAFDAVCTPAVKSARPTLEESAKINRLNESLIRRQINESFSTEELNTIKTIVESSILPDPNSIIELVNNKLSELNSQSPNSSDTITTSTTNSLAHDLEDAYDKIRTLEEDNKELKAQLASSALNSNTISNQEVDQVSIDEDPVVVTDTDSETNDSQLEDDTEKLDYYKSQLQYASKRLRDYRKLVSSLNTKLNNLRARNSEVTHQYVQLKESKSDTVSKSLLIEANRTIKLQSSQIRQLSRRLNESMQRCNNLEDNSSKLVQEYEHKLQKLSESYQKAIATSQSEYRQTLSKCNDKITNLNESLSKIKTNTQSIKLSESQAIRDKTHLESEAKTATDKYLQIRASQSGLSEESVRKVLPAKYTTDDIDRVIQDLTDQKLRLRSVSHLLSEDNKVVTSMTTNTSNSELNGTESFLQRYSTLIN